MRAVYLALPLFLAVSGSGCIGSGLMGSLTGRKRGKDQSISPANEFTTTISERMPSNKRKPAPLGEEVGPDGRVEKPLTPEEREAARLERADMAFENGKTSYEARNFAAAETHFRRAVEVDPDEPMYQNWLGVTLGARGSHAAAVQVFDQALRLLDSYPVGSDATEQQLLRLEATVYANKGNALREIGRNSEALQCYEAAYGANPGLARLPYEIGNLYLKTGHYQKSEEMFLRSMAQAPQPDDPQRVKTRLGLAILYHMTGHDEQALNYVLDIEKSGFAVAADLRAEIVQGAARQREGQRTASAW